MDLTSKSLSHGVGGSYTKWQREPPAHRVYQVETPEGVLRIDVYAENRAIEDADHATIQLIEDANEFKTDLSWADASEDVQDAVREHLAEKVATDEWFN